MKRYYNSKTNSWYREGETLTFVTDNGVFSGIPSLKQLKDWGFVLHVEPTPQPVSEEAQNYTDRQKRMNDIQRQLDKMDYLTSKESDGEDMSEYDEKYGGDWHEYRRQLRSEFRILKKEQEAYTATLQDDSISNYSETE